MTDIRYPDNGKLKSGEHCAGFGKGHGFAMSGLKIVPRPNLGVVSLYALGRKGEPSAGLLMQAPLDPATLSAIAEEFSRLAKDAAKGESDA